MAVSKAMSGDRTGCALRSSAVHLLGSDLASAHRMRRIVAEACPLLVACDENAFIVKLPSDEAELAEVLDLFEAKRRFTARWLCSLPHEAFARMGVHAQRSEPDVHGTRSDDRWSMEMKYAVNPVHEASSK